MTFINSETIPLNEDVLAYLNDTLTTIVEAKSAIRQFITTENPSDSPLMAKKETVKDHPLEKVEVASFHYTPIIDTKTIFSIKREELEKWQAGIQNIDIDAFESAINRLVVGEDKIFFSGIPSNQITGIIDQLETPTLSLKKDPQHIIEGILKGAVLLRGSYIVGPYTLIVGLDFLELTAQIIGDKVLAALLEEELENELIVSEGFSGALLVPIDSANFVLERQNEMEVSYLSQDTNFYHWQIRNRFSFQLLDNKNGIYFTLA